jgi:uncharacterized protein (TIGR00730 family)
MKVAVYCGSKSGTDESFKQTAEELGEMIAREGYSLVYGAGSTGLMGIVSQAVLDHGGEILGVAPRFLMGPESTRDDCTKLIITETMAERKKIMEDEADAYVALPGGTGTLEEVAEVLSLGRLKDKDKPCILLSIDGYWKPLQSQMGQMVAKGFLPEVPSFLHFADNVGQVSEILKTQNSHA